MKPQKLSKQQILELISRQVQALMKEQDAPEQTSPAPAEVPADPGPTEEPPAPAPDAPAVPDASQAPSDPTTPSDEEMGGEEGSASPGVIGGGTSLNIGGGGGFGGGGSSEMDTLDGDNATEDSPSDGEGQDKVGEIPVNYEDPTGAVYDEAERLAGVTEDIPKLTAAVKASIQANFSNYEEAKELLNKLKMSKNPILNAVGQRLTLFMERKSLYTGKRKKKIMEISEKELRKMVKEAVRSKMLKEGSFFEQAKLKQEMDSLALDFLEKVSTKLGIDPTNLPPEAEGVFNKVHDELRSAVKAAAAQMLQLGTIVNAAEEV